MKYERLKELMAKPGLSVKEMREKDQLVNELLPFLMGIYDWAGQACYLMCDPEEQLHRGQMLKLVKEWDNMPEHAQGIKEMGEAWARGE